jgi:saccharopine dehydrogenase (NAD+, L-glutamate forming)
MVNIGKNQNETAMARTVGLPVGIAALKILNGTISTPGVQLPISKEVYGPILKELEENGIHFREEEKEYMGYNPFGVVGN